MNKSTPRPAKPIEYPTSDGKPMAETDLHRDLMFLVIHTLQDWYASDPNVYVTGNILLFYEEGNKRRHISPDCFVVRGIPRATRDYYLLWLEGKSPEVVIELTSKTTKNEDLKKKFLLYQDVLKVQEYYMFDATEDYLKPSLQGFQLKEGKFERIEMVNKRMPSAILGLHLERHNTDLRFWNPLTGKWFPTRNEVDAEKQRRLEKQEKEILEERQKSAEERLRAEAAIKREAEARRREQEQQQEIERLQKLLSEMQKPK